MFGKIWIFSKDYEVNFFLSVTRRMNYTGTLHLSLLAAFDEIAHRNNAFIITHQESFIVNR